MSLFVYGDSWPAGAELNTNEQTFGEIIAKKLNKKFYNFSECSTSIYHLLLQFKKSIPLLDKNSQLIFFLTSPVRDIIFEEGLPMEVQPQNPQYNSYYTSMYSEELSTFKINTLILCLEKLCEKYQVDYYFIWGWDKVELWEEVNQARFFPKSASELFTKNFTNIIELKNSKNQYIWPNGGHPNQSGHQLIADKFIDWYKNS